MVVGRNRVAATIARHLRVEAGAHHVAGPVQVVEVAHGVGEAQLDVAEGPQSHRPLAGVGQAQVPQLDRAGLVRAARRHEVEGLRPHPGALGGDPRVAGPMAALVAVEGAPHRLPGGTPELPGVLAPEVDVAARLVGGERVVAVAADPAVARVAVEGEAPAGVGDDPAVAALAQVVEPGGRGVGPRDDELGRLGVEVAVLALRQPPAHRSTTSTHLLRLVPAAATIAHVRRRLRGPRPISDRRIPPSPSGAGQCRGCLPPEPEMPAPCRPRPDPAASPTASSSGPRRPPTRSRARSTPAAGAPSIWDTFSHTPGTTHHGDTGDVTSDHYRHLDQDLDLVADLGTPAFCFSVAWPRVQPARQRAGQPARGSTSTAGWSTGCAGGA